MNKLPFYHEPVLAQEVLHYLLINPDGIYYDGTLGGGGHALLFLQKLTSQALYIGVDRDEQALEYARRRLSAFHNVVYYHGLYNDIGSALQAANCSRPDVIFLDLGVSSHQINSDQRGFAFRPHIALDMRMDREQALTAADILAEYEEKDLIRIFKEYGEERHSRRIARVIVRQRSEKPLRFSDDLISVIERCVPGKQKIKSYARIFQALRIEVNRELDILKEALEQGLNYLKPGGRMGVISYHSLEDRMVKNFFKEQENPCTCPPELPVCVCGKQPRLKRLRPWLIIPTEEEIKKNPRARSAKFRVGEKL